MEEQASDGGTNHPKCSSEPEGLGRTRPLAPHCKSKRFSDFPRDPGDPWESLLCFLMPLQRFPALRGLRDGLSPTPPVLKVTGRQDCSFSHFHPSFLPAQRIYCHVRNTSGFQAEARGEVATLSSSRHRNAAPNPLQLQFQLQLQLPGRARASSRGNEPLHFSPASGAELGQEKLQ